MPPDPYDEVLMRLLDERYTRTPFYGVERMTDWLQRQCHAVGQGRVRRLWRTVKYEEVYLNDYENVWAADNRIGSYFAFYNRERPHQSLGYRTPEQVYRERSSEVLAP